MTVTRLRHRPTGHVMATPYPDAAAALAFARVAIVHHADDYEAVETPDGYHCPCHLHDPPAQTEPDFERGCDFCGGLDCPGCCDTCDDPACHRNQVRGRFVRPMGVSAR